MIKRITPFILVAILATGCSGGPSESELATVFEKETRDQIQKQIEIMKSLAAFSPEAKESVIKMTGLLDPKNTLVKKLTIEEQMKKENGDYVSKVTMVIASVDQENMVIASVDQEKKVSMRITTTVVDGHLKVIGTELL